MAEKSVNILPPGRGSWRVGIMHPDRYGYPQSTIKRSHRAPEKSLQKPRDNVRNLILRQVRSAFIGVGGRDAFFSFPSTVSDTPHAAGVDGP